MAKKLNFRQFTFIALFVSLAGAGSALAKKKERLLKCPSKGADKIVVCHSPPGNPDNQRILSIGKNALDAHLSHGDKLGICPNTEYEDMKEECGICDVDVDPTC